ncbi:hypothetical protein M0804_000285 [Polistes exclamans]|nr:hypothetical protein M0804_000285 [Polistes exclamans]
MPPYGLCYDDAGRKILARVGKRASKQASKRTRENNCAWVETPAWEVVKRYRCQSMAFVRGECLGSTELANWRSTINYINEVLASSHFKARTWSTKSVRFISTRLTTKWLVVDL